MAKALWAEELEARLLGFSSKDTSSPAVILLAATVSAPATSPTML